jgi:hypothetical protein
MCGYQGRWLAELSQGSDGTNALCWSDDVSASFGEGLNDLPGIITLLGIIKADW